MSAPLTEKKTLSAMEKKQSPQYTHPQENPHFAHRVECLRKGNGNMLSSILSNTNPRFLSFMVIGRHEATIV